mmetsp:Transcript_22830/g.40712  ORF Transcript_22830/g.40712 Transcript_22830/m.40712 type:complete len:366 (+) Transcript_22830:212-1309(+)
MPSLHLRNIYALSLLSLDRSVVGAFAIERNAISFCQKWRKATTFYSLCSSSDSDDLWDADSPLKQEWASSLPLPENAKDPAMADRARHAMAGVSPTSLEGRCDVNLDGFDCRVKWLHVDPPVLTVDDFLTDKECDAALQLKNVSPPPGVGRVIKVESQLSDSNKSRGGSTRTSTTWYVRYAADALAPLLDGLSELLPKVALEQVEEVQLVRYEGEGQGFGWHKDDLDDKEATQDAGGQRIATLLVYLDECCNNGRTVFRDLRGENNQRLAVSPKRGRALLFFPAVTGSTTLGDAASVADSRKTFGDAYFDDTRADHRTTHAGEPPTGNGNKGQKNIAQLWIHSSKHTPVVFGRGLNRHAEARRRV